MFDILKTIAVIVSSCCNRKPDKFVSKLTKMLKSLFSRTFKKILIHLYHI